MAKQTYSSEEMERYFNDPEFRRKMVRRLKGWSARRRVVVGTVLTLLLALTVWYGIYIISGLPTLDELENPRPELATKVYSIDGDVLDQLFYKNRTRVALDKLPQGLLEGLLATEDKQFYDHWGVNASRFLRQMAINVATFQQAGASTITQQLSRNLYKLKGFEESLFDKITRKIREFITSVQIERNFTKEEILELYLNVSFFGRQAYGIESAAQTYFGKPASNLMAPEYTLLIGMLKGPSYYDPINHPERALNRREVVLASMLRDGILTPADADSIRADSLSIKSLDGDFRAGIAPHFVENIRQALVRKGQKYGFDVYRDGLQIYTTMDSRMQRHAIRAVDEHLTTFQASFDSTWHWEQYPHLLADAVTRLIRDSDSYRRAPTQEAKDSVQTALQDNPAIIDSAGRMAQTIEVGFVAIDPHTGHVLAMVGGRNFRSFKYGINHVSQIKRQPGSAFKPFVYTVALDNGYPACYELLNQPVTIPLPDGTRWTPQNYDLSIGGKYTLRDALKLSINLVTVRAILEIAPAQQVANYANRMGIRTRIPPYESIALGTIEVTPLELVSSFGVFANEGVLVSPFSILRIEDKDGNLIEQNAPERREVLSKETAYLMTNLLEGVVNGGTGRRGVRAHYSGPAAGKTGTTNDYADAWYVGFTPQMVAGAWVGFDDNRIKFGSAEGQGGRAVAPIWGRFMQYTYEDPAIELPVEYFSQPAGIMTDTICVETKKKAREFCPDKSTEIFNAKYPISLCEKHTSTNWIEGEEARRRSKISW